MLFSIILFLIIGAGGILWLMMRQYSGTSGLYRSIPIMTSAEKNFYFQLSDRLRHIRIFTKVRLGDIVDVNISSDSKEYMRLKNRILAKHIDFVLCHPETLEVLLLIELNDSSHNRQDRIDRDNMVQEIVSDAGLHLVFVTTARNYSDDIREIKSIIGQGF